MKKSKENKIKESSTEITFGSNINPVEEVTRKGWLEICEKMAKGGDDKLLIPDIFEDENFENW